MTHQNHKIATIEIIPITGFKFIGEVFYWNESRKSVREKIRLSHNETENPFIDEYDEVVFSEYSVGYLIYFEYDNEENLKKVYSPFGFKIVYHTIFFDYAEDMITIKNKLNSINIFEKKLIEYHLIFEELNLVIGTADNKEIFEFMILFRNIKDVRNNLYMSFCDVKIINFQSDIIS